MRNQGWYWQTYQSQQLRDELTRNLDDITQGEGDGSNAENK